MHQEPWTTELSGRENSTTLRLTWATFWNSLIGEAATRIPEAIRSEESHIPWRMIIATRNRLIHGYLGIDDDTLWSIIQDDLTTLLADLIHPRDKARS